MSSRREEERNEKIIRGLMKLPPNRRCINCNSLVPQYVCTNFWTFVCTTCSGIHREFTHRVKSVSMAKFTTQELEALQNGGNQRAREIYLKEWDAQNSKLPDNSKPDKIREFIKNVYVNKKYVEGKSSDNDSRNAPHLSSHEDDVRRASSYHSYSQSPPYDFQYEERRYGKRTSAALSRKPGSDRGLYEKNFASFLSPSRLTDRSPNHASEDSGSISSGTSREFSSEDLNHLRNNSNVDLFSTTDGGKISHTQRTVSFPGNYGVPCNQLPSSKSIDSTGSVNISSESVQTLQPSLSQSSPPPMNFNGLDLFDAPQNITPTSPAVHFPEFSSKPPIDLFESFPTTSFTSNHVAQPKPPSSKPPVDLFESFPTSTFDSNHLAQPERPSSKPTDLFQSFPTASFTSNHVAQPEPPLSNPPIDLFQSFPTTTFTSNHVAQPEPPSPTLLFSDNPKQTPTVSPNEGWATFDFPQHSTSVENSATVNFSSDSHSFGNFEPNQLPTYPDFSSATLPTWHNDHQNIEAAPSIANSQVWNAFDDPNGHLQIESGYRSSNEATKLEEHTSIPTGPSDINMPLHDFPSIPVGLHSFSFNHVSTNPFDDITFDPAAGYNDVPKLWDMSSMQDALPNGQITTNQDWFSDDPTGPFYPPGSEGVLEFGANQGSSKQLMNGPTRFVGGNPFA